MLLLGVAFSLVPSAMWPSVPKIIPQRQLGTAYALIFFMQNLVALMAAPMIIGWVLDTYCKIGTLPSGGPAYDYQLPMMVFTGFGVLAIVFAFLLKAADKANGYGLERPNQEA
jgi:MFS family permease